MFKKQNVKISISILGFSKIGAGVGIDVCSYVPSRTLMLI